MIINTQALAQATSVVRESIQTFILLAAHLDGGNETSVSVVKLARKLHATPGTITGHLALLRKYGLILPKDLAVNGTRAKTWLLNPFIAWRGIEFYRQKYIKTLVEGHPWRDYQ